MFSRQFARAVALAASFLPLEALAHASLPGIEGFYVGMFHPVSSPSQLMAIISLGVMLGSCAKAQTIPAYVTFAISILLGMVVGQFWKVLGWEEFALLSVATVAATLAAIHPKYLYTPATLLTGIGGFLVGLLSTPDPGPLSPTIITLAGSFIAACVAHLYVSSFIVWLRERFAQLWLHIGLRIIAAWLAAISVLMAALVFVKM